MFNDKITKKIVESAKKVLEAKEENVPPVVMGRLPDSATPSSSSKTGKAKTRKQLDTENAPVVQTGPGGDYVKKRMPSDIPSLKGMVKGAINRLRGK